MGGNKIFESEYIPSVPNIWDAPSVVYYKGEINKETDPTVPAWAKAQNKPSYTALEIGLGNVANERQYSANNPPPSDATKQNKIVASGILQGDGNGNVTAITYGVDFGTEVVRLI